MFPDVDIWNKKINMILAIQSDSSYFFNTKLWSWVGGHFFFTKKPKLGKHMMNNVVVYVVSTIIRNAMLLSYEEYIAVLYLNAKDGVAIWNTLDKFCHPQPETSVQTNNDATYGKVKRTIIQRLSKAMYMYCIDCVIGRTKTISRLLGTWITKYRGTSTKTPRGGALLFRTWYLLT